MHIWLKTSVGSEVFLGRKKARTAPVLQLRGKVRAALLFVDFSIKNRAIEKVRASLMGIIGANI